MTIVIASQKVRDVLF